MKSFDYDELIHDAANNWMVIIDDLGRVSLWLYSVYCAIKIIGQYCKKSDFDVTSSGSYKKKFFIQ